jgi:anoctamin-1
MFYLQNVVAMVMILVRWCIPDVPRGLREQIRREAYLTNEMIIQQEALRARSRMRDHHSSSLEPSGSEPLRRRKTVSSYPGNGPVDV